MKKTKVSKQIPTIVLSRTLISDLCKILDKEHQEDPIEDIPYPKYEVNYTFNNQNVSINEKERAPFIENIPDELGSVELSLKSKKGSVKIEISSNKYYDWNKFSISGEDSTWVYGVSKQVESIIEKYKTRNHFFHTKKGHLIYALCTTGLFFAIFLPLYSANPTSDDGKSSAMSLAAFVFAISVNSQYLLWPSIFQRLFPIIEIEKLKQSKFKTIIITIIIGIISSIIASALFLIVQQNVVPK